MIEVSSDTWLTVKKVVDDGIEASRGALERRGLSMDETEHERGRLAAFREILALGQPRRIEEKYEASQRGPFSDRSGV